MGHVINSPFQVPTGKKKNFSLNLNVYRNAHHFTLAKAKKVYKEMMSESIAKLPTFNRISLRLVMYPKTQRLFDLGNVGSITEKFFLDALVEFEKLPDDNYKYCSSITYEFGEVDKINPRVEIHLNEI
jgi:hypothetical protein